MCVKLYSLRLQSEMVVSVTTPNQPGLVICTLVGLAKLGSPGKVWIKILARASTSPSTRDGDD